MGRDEIALLKDSIVNTFEKLGQELETVRKKCDDLALSNEFRRRHLADAAGQPDIQEQVIKKLDLVSREACRLVTQEIQNMREALLKIEGCCLGGIMGSDLLLHVQIIREIAHDALSAQENHED